MNKGDSVRVSGSSYTYKCQHCRYANWAVFEHKETGKRFLVLNTHLENNHDDESYAPLRTKQVEKLYSYIDSDLAQYKDLPMILCGDMNADYQTGKKSDGSYYYPTESTFNVLNDGTHFKWAKEFEGVQFVAKDQPNFKWYSGYPYTFINNAYKKDFQNNGSAEEQVSSMDKRILDFIFVSPNSSLTPKTYEVIYRNFSTVKGCWKYASDHMPVACELEFNS